MNRVAQVNDSVPPFPLGVRNAFYFQFLNTASFGTLLGVPMILFFKDLGASVFVLGVVTSIAPLLMIFQIPASRHVERIGYRPFVLSGWLLRAIFGIGMAIVALLPSSISNDIRIAAGVIFLAAYNVSRGISSSGYMPWICQLIPETIRGRFLATDQMTGSIAGLFSTLLIAVWLHFYSGMLGYAAVFIFSSIAGFWSIYFLRKIPDVVVPEKLKMNQEIPWREIFQNRSFKRILFMNFLFQIGVSGGGLFWIPLLKDHFGKSSDLILFMVGFVSLIAIGTQYLAGRIIDQTGSKPVLTFAILGAILHLLFWSLIAGHLIPLNGITLFFVMLSSGIAFPVFNVANTRIVMSTAPALAQSHSFAIFNVTVNLTGGCFPWIWGYGVDAFKSWDQVIVGSWHGNVYSLFYFVTALFVTWAWWIFSQVEEPGALKMREMGNHFLVNNRITIFFSNFKSEGRI